MADLRKTASAVALVVLSLIASWAIARLGDAVAAPRLVPGVQDPKGFRFKEVDLETGEPVRFNACEPVHYVINPALAPPNGVADIHTAFEVTGVASGIRFVYDGVTDETPTPTRSTFQTERYGDRWAPILVAWSNGLPQVDTTAGAEGNRPIAVAKSDHEVNDDGRAVYVTGTMIFDATVPGLREGFGGETWGQAMLHEIGHVVGLDHVDVGSSVMNPVIGLRPASWATGDRAGLWALGVGSPCLKTPDSP